MRKIHVVFDRREPAIQKAIGVATLAILENVGHRKERRKKNSLKKKDVYFTYP
jgi:hypothetical protein